MNTNYITKDLGLDKLPLSWLKTGAMHNVFGFFEYFGAILNDTDSMLFVLFLIRRIKIKRTEISTTFSNTNNCSRPKMAAPPPTYTTTVAAAPMGSMAPMTTMQMGAPMNAPMAMNGMTPIPAGMPMPAFAAGGTPAPGPGVYAGGPPVVPGPAPTQMGQFPVEPPSFGATAQSQSQSPPSYQVRCVPFCCCFWGCCSDDMTFTFGFDTIFSVAFHFVQN